MGKGRGIEGWEVDGRENTKCSRFSIVEILGSCFQQFVPYIIYPSGWPCHQQTSIPFPILLPLLLDQFTQVLPEGPIL